jgi:MtN3 and saliva related transmembrane protein
MMLSPFMIEMIGAAAATLTTLSWVPQAVRTIRTRETKALSLWTQIGMALGIVSWLVYGLLIESWPLIIANIFTSILVFIILVMKIRYG